MVELGEKDCEPEVDLPPLQPPEALQLVALLDDQERVADCPEATELGLAEKLTVGTGVGAETFTVTYRKPLLPPEPEQLIP